jgi:hypothetical protein
MLTCRQFRSIITKHDHVIVRDVVRRTSKTSKIILWNLSETSKKRSLFPWLHEGHHLTEVIDRAVRHLEYTGALRDENNIFKAGTTDIEPCHARRAVRTILLATQVLSIQGSWMEIEDYIKNAAPDFMNSFACHVRGIIRFMVCNAYLFIEGLDASMTGMEGVRSLPFSDQIFQQIVHTLFEGVFIFGPSLLFLLLIIRPKFPTVKVFFQYLPFLYRTKEPWSYQPDSCPLRVHRHLSLHVEMEHRDTLRRCKDEWGIQQVSNLDLTKWAKAVPSDDAWEELMDKWEWVQPMEDLSKLVSNWSFMWTPRTT